MAEKLVKLGLKREDGFLYYIGKDGHVWRAKMARGGKKGGKSERVKTTWTTNGNGHYPVKKQPGYLYFLDKKGDVSRAKMVRR
ncbi:MAG: hypothetical protein HY747_07985 [Elusimicrobia bacterium]|nr:hypothetical protein [Elusimicrobiota bacterium]